MLRIILMIGLFLVPVSANAYDYCKGSFCYQKKARVTCLKPGVWSVLQKVAAQVGRLEITSGCDGKHASKSFHYSGRAVDFRAIDASQKDVVAVLRKLPEVGGIGTYSRSLVHADIGGRKAAWHGHQRSGGRRRFAAMWPVQLDVAGE
jgi:uncharacterized protein YcbK (DUF882 family)